MGGLQEEDVLCMSGRTEMQVGVVDAPKDETCAHTLPLQPLLLGDVACLPRLWRNADAC